MFLWHPTQDPSMQTREFLDQAFFLTAHFDVVAAATRPLAETALQQFWVASRTRFDTWAREFRCCTDQMEATEYASPAVWIHWTPFLEEVLLSEIVTRLWSYLLQAIDDRMGTHEYAPIGHSALRTHLDARRRVLTLILRGRQSGLSPVHDVNRRRLNAERWTDLLLAQIDERSWLGDYAFDVQRVRRFRGAPGASAAVCSVIQVAGRAAFADCGQVPVAHEPLHNRIHAAILGCYGAELFQDDGPLLSTWQARLLALTDDMQGWLQEWLSETPSVERDGTTRWRGTLPRF